MENKVRQLIKEAMIEKNENKKITYKSILEGAQKIAKNDSNRAMNDDDIVKAAKNEIKSLNDLMEYVSPDDSAKINDITEKVEFCKVLLPKMLTAEEITAYLTTNNIEKNIGACMKTLKAQFGNSLDGKMAQEVVKSYIAS